MARRRKTSPVEDLMEIVAMLPWWVGVVLALASYLLLHSFASKQVVAVAVPSQIAAAATQTIWKTLAGVGQFIVPVLCLVGAAMSAWRRRVRQSLVVGVAQSEAADALDGMDWREFEMLVGEGFRLQGYQVVETGGGGADGGVDLVLRKPGKDGGEKFLVQCKQWRAYKVGVDVVRELYGVMAASGATGGFVVTSGRFTADAISFAAGRNVDLIDGPKLHGLIRQAQAGNHGSPALVRAAVDPGMPGRDTAPQAASCPLCSKPMVRRTAKRGVSAGAEFWGCTSYPACRGTRPIA